MREWQLARGTADLYRHFPEKKLSVLLWIRSLQEKIFTILTNAFDMQQ